MGFSKTFSLDKTVDEEKLTATVKNGILTVSAPKDLKKLEENIRRIPVVTAAAIENASTSNDNNGSEKNTEHKEKEEADKPVIDLVDKEEKTSDKEEKTSDKE